MQNLTALLKTAILGFMMAATAVYGATPSVTVGSGAGQPNTEVTINVSFENTSGGDVVGFQFDIEFDSTNLTPDVTGCGTAPEISCSIPTSGTVRVFGDGNLSAIASGSLGSIGFTIANNSALIGTVETLEVTNALFSNDQGGPITAGTLTNGTVAIQAAPAPAIAVSPTSQNFTAANGSTDSRTFTVTNVGNASGLTVSSALISGTDAANFSVTSNSCPTTGGLGVAGTCSIVVQFAPNNVASFGPASLDITSSAGTENIELTGDGTAGPAGILTITPATYNFGDVLTQSGASTQSFTVTNTGAVGSTVDIDTITVTAPFSIAGTGNTCATAELDKDETCTVSVTFTPTADGPASDTLSVSGADLLNNNDTRTGTSGLSGTGVTEARPTSNPASGADESEVVGPEGSYDFTVVLGNTGNENYAVSCGLDDSDDTSIWSVDGPTTITAVTPGQEVTVTTSCDIPDTETYTATLSCSLSGGGVQETYTYSYSCVGLPPLPIPVDNKWALVLLALMMLMVASFGFRFIARQ